MNKLTTITYYEASDGTYFPKDDLERAEIYQDHLNALAAAEKEYFAKIKKIDDEATRRFYGDL